MDWTAGEKRILVFGDSNSWGWIPRSDGRPTGRYADHERWPGVAETVLGHGYKIVVDAVGGRTTDQPDTEIPPLNGPRLDGTATIATVIAANLPLDLVVIMLGTNDAWHAREANRIAEGASRLIDIVRASGHWFGTDLLEYRAPTTLLVCPPPVETAIISGELHSAAQISRSLPETFGRVASTKGTAFFDAGRVIQTDGVDGWHLSLDAHRKLGTALASVMRRLLE